MTVFRHSLVIPVGGNLVHLLLVLLLVVIVVRVLQARQVGYQKVRSELAEANLRLVV